jgi:hypothetical protein
MEQKGGRAKLENPGGYKTITSFKPFKYYRVRKTINNQYVTLFSVREFGTSSENNWDLK